MTELFEPQLHILPPPQRALWRELGEVPASYTLYGGTAVALHLGHRVSVDFDFFGNEDIRHQQLLSDIPFLIGAKIIQQDKNTLTCLVDRGGPVKVSFFGLPGFKRVERPRIAEGNRLKVASLLDLAGTKASVVQQRCEAKDYIDLDAMMTAGIGLAMTLAAASRIFGPSFNPLITLKALSYFEDGDLLTLPAKVKTRLRKAVASTDPGQLPELS